MPSVPLWFVILRKFWRETTGEECAREVREAIWTAQDGLETES
ncbi:hypothetical protein [Nostoc sp.]